MKQVLSIPSSAASRGRRGRFLKALALEVAVLGLLLAAATAVAALPVLAGVWRHLQ